MRHQVYCVHSQRGWGSSGRPASHNMDVSSRCVGSLLGMAVCDAVGTTVEFMPPGSFSPVDDMVGGGKFSLLAGQVRSSISVNIKFTASFKSL